MGTGCWRGFGGRGNTRTLLLALLPCHSGQGKAAPRHGASNDGDRLGKGACGSEVTALPGRSSASGGTLGAVGATSHQLCRVSVGAMHRETTRESCSVITVA